MSELKLYSYYRSSCSYRVRIALYLKELSFQYEPIHLVKDGGQQFEATFKKKNPLSQVPCLEHKGFFLTQSLAILLYLEDLKPKPTLLPKDIFKRAAVLSFCEMIGSGTQPLQNFSVLKFLETKTQGDKKEWAKYWITKGLLACEEFVKAQPGNFCFGQELTLADLFLIPQMYNARRFDVKITNLPTLEKIESYCLKISAFQKASPENQMDTPS